jgi:rare lipoprotein A
VTATKRGGFVAFIICLILSFAAMPSDAAGRSHHRGAHAHKATTHVYKKKWARSHRHARGHRHTARHKARAHRRSAHRHHWSRAHRASRQAYRHKHRARHHARRTHRKVAVSRRAGRATDFSGIASIYGVGSGRTANGERSNVRGLTAAHKTLPFGTRVAVTNRKNGRSVVVRINDRGPFVRGRVIDLTPAAARAIGFSGLTPVSLSVLR